MGRRWSVGTFESRLRVVLLGVLLAALLLQAATAMLVGRVRSSAEAELLQPLYEVLDEMQVRPSGPRSGDAESWQRRRGLETRQRYVLRDTSRAAVARLWERIPPAAQVRMLRGQTVRIDLEHQDAYEIQLARISGRGSAAEVLSVGRLLPDYGRVMRLERWNSGVRVAGLTLLFVAVFMVAREMARPFRRLQRVAADAQLSFDLQAPPTRDQWDEVIDTFRATIDRLRVRETELAERFRSSEVERLRLDQLNSKIIDAIPSALVAADGSGRIVLHNRSLTGLPGVPREALGSSLQELFASWPPLVEAITGESWKLGRACAGECSVAHGGESYHYSYRIVSVADGGTLLLLEDRTRLHRLEVLLAQRARLSALGETAAGFAHELRNALAAIIGYARLCRREQDRHGDELARRIEDEAGDMERMLSRFLEVARPTELQPVETDAAALATEVVAKFRARFASRRISLTEEYASETRVCIDPFWFRQALCNLLENALELVPGGGEVKVTSLATATDWRLIVMDSGPGVAAEWQDQIWSPFFSMRPGGTGLGLALVQKVMTAHEGQVEVRKGPLGGAQFTMTFPRTPVLPRKTGSGVV